MIIYKSYTYLCVIDTNLFKFMFTVVFNYLGVDEVYITLCNCLLFVFCNIIGYLWTRKIVLGLGLEDLSSFNNITA